MKYRKIITLITICSLFLIGCGESKNHEQNGLEPSIKEEPIKEEPIETEVVEDVDTLDSAINSFLFENGIANISPEFENNLSYSCMYYDYENSKLNLTLPSSFTLEELLQNIKESEDLMNADPVASYYTTTTSANVPVLLVKVDNINIYATGDTSFALFAFSVIDNQLQLTFASDSWDRNYLTVYDNLTFSNYGSSGAGDSVESRMMIDENGYYKLVYKTNYLFADWIGMNILDDYESVSAFTEEDEVDIITTSDGKYFVCTNIEGNEDRYKAVVSKLEADGATQVKDSVEITANAMQEAGIIENAAEITNWSEIN